MAETMKYPVENELGCGFMTAIFQLRGLGSTRKAPGRGLPTNTRKNAVKFPTTHNVKSAKPPPRKMATNSIPASSRCVHDQNQNRRASSSSNSSAQGKTSELAKSRKLKREPSLVTSGELSLTISNRQSGTLYRASSSNVMLAGHLGNLKQQGTKTPSSNNSPKPLDFHQRTVITGNILRKPSVESPQFRNVFDGLINKLDPEALKSKGNEKYKEGRFEEALALYNQAIYLDSNRASYHSNKSAALIGLGRLIEAAFECREAIRIEPSYLRAHNRLATLYLRLGEAEKALNHYRKSGLKGDSREIAKAQALKTHLTRCTKASELRDWNSMLKESQSAVSSGADSAPQIHAMQVDALLKLHRHQEAHDTFQKGPHFDNIESCSRLFGPACSAFLLTIQAQIYMLAGKIEDALDAARQAARLNSSSREVNAVAKRIQAVAFARLNGNRLFKASKFSEALIAYNEGLEQHDAYNPILLCNRAACRSKLGQFEKAAEDCTAALNVRPSYSKARLRRANCNAKLGRWKAAIQDYEMLMRETPGDEEVGGALFEARAQLKKKHGDEVTKDVKFGSNLILISSTEGFRHYITAPGMSVVLFCNKTCNKQVLKLMEQVRKGFPSVNFLKVEIEDHPHLAKSEGVTSVPAFKLYKNGYIIKEIPGNNPELLESSVKLYSS